MEKKNLKIPLPGKFIEITHRILLRIEVTVLAQGRKATVLQKF